MTKTGKAIILPGHHFTRIQVKFIEQDSQKESKQNTTMRDDADSKKKTKKPVNTQTPTQSSEFRCCVKIRSPEQYISHRRCRSGLPPEGETEELQLELDYTWLQTSTRADLVNVGETNKNKNSVISTRLIDKGCVLYR